MINLKAINFNVNNKTRAYLDKRLKSLKKFVDLKSPNSTLDVEVGKTTEHHQKGEIFRTELNLEIGGEFFRAVEKSEDILSSIDIAIEELITQLRRRKDKKETLYKKGGRKFKEMIRRFRS